MRPIVFPIRFLTLSRASLHSFPVAFYTEHDATSRLVMCETPSWPPLVVMAVLQSLLLTVLQSMTPPRVW